VSFTFYCISIHLGKRSTCILKPNIISAMIEKILYAAILTLTTFLMVVTRILFELRNSSYKWRRKLAQLRILREGRSRKDFIQYFMHKGYKRRIIKFVYKRMQEYIKAQDLILLPDDDFRIIYEVDEDEWEYSLKDWFEEIRKPFPSMEYFNYLNQKYQKVNFEYLMELFDPKEKLSTY
jgi:hypothetical protein